VRLRDGARMRIRTAEPFDEAALRSFLDELSPESVRHFSATGVDAADSARWLVEHEPDRQSLIAVRDDGRIVGHAVGTGIGTTTPELAVVVADDHRRRGVAGALLERLAYEARARGVPRITVDVPHDAAAMLGLLRDRFTIHERRVNGAVSIELVLRAPG
jgi:GNAT superfamily N-acetyltransferase